MEGTRIEALHDPVSNTNAANKQCIDRNDQIVKAYVDTKDANMKNYMLIRIICINMSAHKNMLQLNSSNFSGNRNLDVFSYGIYTDFTKNIIMHLLI